MPSDPHSALRDDLDRTWLHVEELEDVIEELQEDNEALAKELEELKAAVALRDQAERV